MQDAGTQGRRGGASSSSTTPAQRRQEAMKRKREIMATQRRCLTGSHLSPYCRCSTDDHRCSPAPPFNMPIWLPYRRQIRQSHCFDIDDYPGSYDGGITGPDSGILGGASIQPVPPYMDFNNNGNVLMELANLATQEHNAKECPVCHNTKDCHDISQLSKYEVLKIEKANFSLQGTSYQYWMTVKVLNLTLGTPIETFLVHAGIDFIRDEKVIFCCRPKGEAIVGLPSCDFCYGLLHSEEDELDLEGVVRKGDLPDKFLVDLCWDDDDFIPKGALKEHREAFQRIYWRYFRQIFQSDGFDLDVYPGDAKEAVYIPHLDFEKEADMLMELANHAIQDCNNGETSAYKYKVSYIEKVNFLMAECREFFMTVKVINLTLHTPLETFQIHAYKGPHEENVVRLCRKKVLI